MLSRPGRGRVPSSEGARLQNCGVRLVWTLCLQKKKRMGNSLKARSLVRETQLRQSEAERAERTRSSASNPLPILPLELESKLMSPDDLNILSREHQFHFKQILEDGRRSCLPLPYKDFEECKEANDEIRAKRDWQIMKTLSPDGRFHCCAADLSRGGDLKLHLRKAVLDGDEAGLRLLLRTRAHDAGSRNVVPDWENLIAALKVASSNRPEMLKLLLKALERNQLTSNSQKQKLKLVNVFSDLLTRAGGDQGCEDCFMLLLSHRTAIANAHGLSNLEKRQMLGSQSSVINAKLRVLLSDCVLRDLHEDFQSLSSAEKLDASVHGNDINNLSQSLALREHEAADRGVRPAWEDLLPATSTSVWLGRPSMTKLLCDALASSSPIRDGEVTIFLYFLDSVLHKAAYLADTACLTIIGKFLTDDAEVLRSITLEEVIDTVDHLPRRDPQIPSESLAVLNDISQRLRSALETR